MLTAVQSCTCANMVTTQLHVNNYKLLFTIYSTYTVHTYIVNYLCVCVYKKNIYIVCIYSCGPDGKIKYVLI